MVSCLGMHCLPMSHKKDARFILVKPLHRNILTMNIQGILNTIGHQTFYPFEFPSLLVELAGHECQRDAL